LGDAVPRWIFPILFLLVIPLCTSGAHASWKVKLSSGVTVDANSYHIEKGRIYLEYPVGEVSFPLSEIKSVAADSGEVTEFQTRGVPQKEKEDTARPQGSLAKGVELNQSSAPATVASADADGPSVSQPNNVVKPRFTDEQLAQLVSRSVADTSAPVPYDPDAEAIIQASENTDDAQQAELAKKINTLFDEVQ
jgi:hypothetical protein